ncbi:MAG: hypothetical protein Q8P95_04625 [bacterium]|nr:hypothetical protein [bacterium]
MAITPQRFAHLLRASLLADEVQQSLLNLLSLLTSDQIEAIAILLEENVQQKEILFSQAESKKSQVLLKMEVEFERLKEKM